MDVWMDVCMHACMYVCRYVRMYVCMCMCVTKLRVKDAARERRCVCVCARQCRPFFSPALQYQLLCMRQHCGPEMGWTRCFMIFCATRFAMWQLRLSYIHESDDDDIEERYLAKYVNQPQISETHRHHRHSNRCRFAMHLHTLLPTLGQSSCSRGHRLVDSLSGHATRACPPSKKLTGWAPELVANTRLHACDFVTTWVGQPMKSYWFHHIAYIKQWIAV